MMIAFLIATATAPAAPARVATAIDAEHAFARDAKRIGQWSAFRKWADRDAVMFTPQAVWASTFLKTLKDPPNAITWRPARSFVSCDGRTAVNTGPWFKQDDKLGGFFTTVWQRTPRGWRWVYDGGGEYPEGTSTPGMKVEVKRANCARKAPGAPISAPPPLTNREARQTPEDSGRGQSADRSVGWDWKVEKDGSRKLRVFQWTGRAYAEVLTDEIPAPRTK